MSSGRIRGLRNEVHFLWLLLQFDICMFCLFASASKTMKWWSCFVCFLCFSMSCEWCVLTAIDLVILLQHSPYNLIMMEDFILQRLSSIICELWQGQFHYLDMKVMQKAMQWRQSKPLKTKSLWLKVLEVVFYCWKNSYIVKEKNVHNRC